MNFTVKSTPDSVTVFHPATKSKLTVTVAGKTATREKVSNFETKRELDCATHLHKFMADALTGASIIKGNTEKKINTLVDALKTFGNVSSMRTLNNTIRRHFDPGTAEYFKDYFYEGTAKHALKPRIAQLPGASAPAKKVPKAITPAKVATPKAATKTPAKKATTAKKVAAPKTQEVPASEPELIQTPSAETVENPAELETSEA